MKWSPQWGGFIVERDDDCVTKTALNCKAGDVVFFNEPGAIMRGYPIAIRRKGSEQVENLNVGHATLWRSLMLQEARNAQMAGLMAAAQVYPVISQMLDQMLDQVLDELPDEPAHPVSDDPDVYQRAYHAIVGSTHIRADVDVSLPIDDSNQMRTYGGIRHSDDRLDVYLGEEEPIALVPSARKLHGVLMLAPQSGFCSSGNKIYGAMPD